MMMVMMLPHMATKTTTAATHSVDYQQGQPFTTCDAGHLYHQNVVHVYIYKIYVYLYMSVVHIYLHTCKHAYTHTYTHIDI